MECVVVENTTRISKFQVTELQSYANIVFSLFLSSTNTTQKLL